MPGGRRVSDLLLFAVTLGELSLLVRLTPTFTMIDWIYVVQHALVLGVALTRSSPAAQDHSLPTALAVCISYSYPYAQVLSLRWAPAVSVSHDVGLALVVLSALLSLSSLLFLGRVFGVRPALRGLVMRGPYRIARHPMYLAYVLGDIGYNLQGWNGITVLMVVTGWGALLYRIHAEERVLSQDFRWPSYVALVRYRLIPGVW